MVLSLHIVANKSKAHTVNMTEGAILPLIVRFAVPLLLGNLFQQLYNMVDAWVIGQTGMDAAYAAVGNVGPVTNILIGFFTGFATGAGVLISQSFGRGDHDTVRRCVHTATALTLILSVVFTVLGVCLTPWITSVIFEGSTGASEITPYATEYLTLYFAGITGLLIYNMGSGILRAVGDSRHPLYFLIAAATVNIIGDFVFVFGLNMGVRGVALATILSQAASAILTVIQLLRVDSSIRLLPRQIKLELPVLKEIVRLGLPAAIQVGLTSFANVFVQSYIAGADGNQTLNLAGFTTYSKVDQIIFLPLSSLGLAITTFVGQNKGVGDYKRARKGTMQTLALTYGIVAALIALIWIFSPPISAIFNANESVVELAVMLLRTVIPFFLFCPLNQVLAGSLRGLGKSVAPMVCMLSCFVGLRQVYLFVMSNYISNSLMSIVLAYPAGWVCCAVAILITYLTIEKRESLRHMPHSTADASEEQPDSSDPSESIDESAECKSI